MHEIEVSRVIEASPEQVWAVITNVAGSPQTFSGIDSVQLMTDGPYAVGTRWRETRTVFGRSSTQEMWVALADPFRRTQVKASSGGTDYVSTFQLTPLDAPGESAAEVEGPAYEGREPAAEASGTAYETSAPRTELTMRFSAEMASPNAVQKVGLKLFSGMATKATRKALEQDLADIAAAAEQG